MPPEAPCAWNITVPSCSQDEWNSYTAETRAQATLFATTTLWAATGRRFGICDVTVYPCGKYTDGYWQGPGYFGPEGRWLNWWGGSLSDYRRFGCGSCGPTNCSCEARCRTLLLGPIASVTEVVVDGVILPTTSYRVDSARWLVRTDGACWPEYVDQSTNVDEFKVTYKQGEAVSPDVLLAAGTLAVEWARGCSGGDCRLPRNVTSITRQGVQLTMLEMSELLKNNLTGIPDVDQVIISHNPNGLRQRSRIYNIDNPDPIWR